MIKQAGSTMVLILSRAMITALVSQTDKRQATEVALTVDVLNRMLALGRPSYVRIV